MRTSKTRAPWDLTLTASASFEPSMTQVKKRASCEPHTLRIACFPAIDQGAKVVGFAEGGEFLTVAINAANQGNLSDCHGAEVPQRSAGTQAQGRSEAARNEVVINETHVPWLHADAAGSRRPSANMVYAEVRAGQVATRSPVCG